ncbi:NAD(P)-dependent oxidoreductase [Pseudomonas sp. TNT3]|uniref:NAD-dependent epimerase/dehydratase family protein n=1 Tax=Pseudomonas sp. TNT3 TaxID=2654097 RepID=UPI00139108A6|nr:NAD(P)-dependent oxidoreductase [Pseudomonas sp. TNT3]KAI2689532.1 NAD(P)-dependent oxidoreductase [Pseudomonas sp. TNT3]
MTCAVIFGGTGFIGTFFAEHLESVGSFNKVYLFDLEPLDIKTSEFRRTLVRRLHNTEIIIGDVRDSISWEPLEDVTLIANFAAVHREPGHEDFEYFETNLSGAENVCAWAEKVGCNNIIFTSSISPYGPSEAQKTEKSTPVPTTAYGGSKLTAEKIHQIWLARDENIRHLVIVRPGVVFGPGEGGNVSRLIKAVIGRYFFYMGNRGTRKAGTYVKELCMAMWWVLEWQTEKGQHLTLFNMSMNPGPSIQEYVQTICKIAKIQRNVPSIPYPLLLTVAYVIEIIAGPLKIKHPFSPVRIRKMVRSNNTLPAHLVEIGYSYKYTLETALADWKSMCPKEWQ